MKVIFKKSGGFLREQGHMIMEEAMASVSAFDAVYSQNDDMILGALEAMEQAGIAQESVVTIGTDGIPEALREIDKGRLDATIQYPIVQAEIALERLARFLRTGELPEWKKPSG